MRILHTADWHMNMMLGRQDRTEDICRALQIIAEILEAEQIDVMVVAGDLFDTSRIDGMQQAIAQIKTIFRPFLSRGGTIVAILGNHDSEKYGRMLSDAMDLVQPAAAVPQGFASNGRLYLAPRPRPLVLRGHDGCAVQFALMPYPSASCYLQPEAMSYSSLEEKHESIQRAFTTTLRSLEQRLDPTLPSVLVSHIYVRGVRPHQRAVLSAAEDILFDPADIPTHWAYVAYGHIHGPQTAVPGAEHIWYAGSIERLDISEAQDTKSVSVVEIAAAGRTGPPRLISLPSTPIYHVQIDNPAIDIPRLRDNYPDAQHALVRYTLQCTEADIDVTAVCRDVQAIFPRWYERTVRRSPAHTIAVTEATRQQIEDVPSTVRQYLNQQLAASPLKADVLALADRLLAALPAREEIQ